MSRLKRLRRYAITGLDVSAARQIPPMSHRFHDDERPPDPDLEHSDLLRAVPAWAPPGQPCRKAVGGWLATASRALNAPLREVVRRVSAMVPSSWTPQDLARHAELLDHIFSPAEVRVFSEWLYSGPPWISPGVPPGHIVKTSAALGRSVADVLQLFERFAPLGYHVIGRDLYPPNLQPVEHAALLYADKVPQPLSPLQLFILAGQLSMAVAQVRDGLGRLVEAGLVCLPEHDPLPDALPSETERSIINEDLTLYSYRKNAQVIAVDWAATWLIVRAIGAPDFGGFEDRLASCRRLLRLVALPRPVSMPEIIHLVYLLDTTVAEAIDHFRLLFGDAADLTALPAAAFSCSATCHRVEEFVALVGHWERPYFGDYTIDWSMRPGDIAVGAARARQTLPAFLDRFEPFRQLGVPFPVLSDDTRRRLSDRLVDRHDVAMLHRTDGYGQDHPVDVVTPLWLVQVAGRFGWTVAEARARLEHFEPLGLEVQCSPEHCPDTIVAWQDLLILTTHLDGQAPVLHGQVSSAHLAAAAEEIGESVANIVDRLAKYKDLFEYTVGEEDRNA